MITKKFLLIALTSLPVLCFGQQTITDSAYNQIINTDCDGKLFTRVETIPAIKNGTAALADSIVAYLKTKNTPLANGKVEFRFLVTSQSLLLNIQKEPRIIINEAALREALEKFSTLWIPARQNGRIVCAYVRCELDFFDDTLTIKLGQ